MRLGSLLDDIGAIARKIVASTSLDDVIVWVDAGAEVFCAHLSVAPEIPAEAVMGTYRMGVDVNAIEEDLRALREWHVSASMLF